MAGEREAAGRADARQPLKERGLLLRRPPEHCGAGGARQSEWGEAGQAGVGQRSVWIQCTKASF